jgi:hypothetical protein
MSALQTTESRRRRFPFVLVFFIRATVLLVPAFLLLGGASRSVGHAKDMLVLGAVFQLIVCALALLSQKSWQYPLSPSVITLYLIGLGWLWLGSERLSDWFQHFAQAILLMVPLLVFAVQTLASSGAPALRRARLLAEGLTRREEWPADLSLCRELPEVQALREAVQIDATPALNLLQHPKIAVRVAALGALEFRKSWRPGQVELIVQLAQRSPEAPVRAAALWALANLDDRWFVESLAEFLQDPSGLVRRAAIVALLWDCEHRWPWLRLAVHRSLSDPAHTDDGPLQPNGRPFSVAAVADLKAWASEKSTLGVRAAKTLAVHYRRLLNEQADEELVNEVQEQVANPHAPAALRLELAQLLVESGTWHAGLQQELLAPTNPAALRLMAADALLRHHTHPQALAVLHDLARVPNREMALATAAVVQRCLGVDLGLGVGEPLPPPQSRHAAEVTRRVMQWATHTEAHNPSALSVGPAHLE